MTKQKGPDSVRARGIAKEQSVTVADGSLQPRAPGWVAQGSANVQSANVEQAGAALRARGSLQGSAGDHNVGSQRGGGGAQQAGWSARQSAQRMQARGEEDRLNASRQSGNGGAEQRQQPGSQASVPGPAASMQSDKGGARQLETRAAATGRAAKPSKKKADGAGQ